MKPLNFWGDYHDTEEYSEHVLRHARATKRDDNSEFGCKWVNCAKKYKHKFTLENHMSKHIPKRFTCSTCHKIFALLDTLRTHVKNQHSDASKEKVTCPTCDKVIVKRNFERHMATHSERRPFPCLYEGCKEAFKTKAHLESHEETLHEQKRSVCSICFHTYSGSCSLRAHMRDVHSGIIHKCPVCGDVLANRSNLRRHIEAKHPES